MSIRKLTIGIIAVIVLLSIILISLQFFVSLPLNFMNDDLTVTKASQYGDCHVLIGEDGNCYIRNGWIDKKNPWGLKNPRAYAMFIDFTFPFSKKLDRFVRMYDGGNAETVVLSYNGGIILTKNREALLFYGTDDYQTPSLFARNILDAKLVDDRVYLVTSQGEFGYCSIEDNQQFYKILENVQSFEETEKLFMVHTEKNELLISDDTFTEDQFSQRISDVAAYSFMCVNCLRDHDIVCCFVTTDGNCWYQRVGKSLLNQFRESSSYDKIAESIVQVSACSQGVLMLDSNQNARMYGRTSDGDSLTWEGDILASNACFVSGGSSSCFIILTDGTYVYYGGYISGVYNDIPLPQ